MLAVLDRLGYSHVTVHGFRSTFATWAEECTDYPDGVREAALAHKYKSETTAAYQRGQKLEKRRALMKDWAQFLFGSNVIGFRGWLIYSHRRALRSDETRATLGRLFAHRAPNFAMEPPKVRRVERTLCQKIVLRHAWESLETTGCFAHVP